MTNAPNPAVSTAPIDWHRQRAQDSARLAAGVSAAGRRIGRYRLVAFGLFALTIVWGVASTPRALWLWWLAFVATLGTFVVLVGAHRRNRAAFAALDHRRVYHERALRRIARDWTSMPVPRVNVEVTEHPYASDLAIIGSGSILQLLDVASSAPGRTTVLDWLLRPPPAAEMITARQRAVQELAVRDDVRVELGVLAIGVGELNPQTLERYCEWSESEGSLANHPGLIWSGRALTAAIVVALLAQAIGLLAYPYWLGIVFLARGFRSVVRRQARDSGEIPGIPFAALGGHRAMLALAENSAFDAPLLVSLAARLHEGPGAATALARVERIAAWAEVRHSPMLHFALDWLLLWDFHVGVAFDTWKGSAGRHVRGWLGTLGEIEALGALSTLAHDQPQWTFPDIHEGDPVTVEAVGLAHPLIADDQRVANDVALGPPGTFLLITGSNMSGKSTLLRAIGANCVLAQAGAPVCAARYRAHMVRIQTSMRVEDSLTHGVSLFMAELRRIKGIVDAARERAPGEAPVLYLFDEVLHGTNSSERRVAARIVLGHLLAVGAIGAVTSHDLSLAADGQIEKAARCVSFADSIDRSSGTPVLHFDYRLRDGLATSTNALALLDIVGLGPSSRQ